MKFLLKWTCIENLHLYKCELYKCTICLVCMCGRSTPNLNKSLKNNSGLCHNIWLLSPTYPEAKAKVQTEPIFAWKATLHGLIKQRLHLYLPIFGLSVFSITTLGILFFHHCKVVRIIMYSSKPYLFTLREEKTFGLSWNWTVLLFKRLL